MSNRIAITGASGFIGRHVSARLAQEADLSVVALGRSNAPPAMPEGVQWRQVPDYDGSTAFAAALDGCETIIHLADAAARTADEGVNHAAVAAEIKASSVSRIVVGSSLYARMDEQGHVTPYGTRKRVLEDAFRGVPGCSVTSLRMPPVYGAGCRGGFATLADLVRRGMPLPLKRADDLRDYIAVENVADLIASLMRSQHSGAFTTLEPSDGQPISTAELATAMGRAMQRPARLFSMPKTFLRLAGRAAGKSEQIDALTSPLRVAEGSVDRIAAHTGWTPRHKMPQALTFLKV